MYSNISLEFVNIGIIRPIACGNISDGSIEDDPNLKQRNPTKLQNCSKFKKGVAH
jgi:hypothetical protein